MRIKCSVYIATSLDGYIAKKDDDISWLDEASANVPEGEDMGYQAFMNTVDALVMGRSTFEKVVTFDKWFYGDKQVIVLSSKELTIPEHLTKTVTHSSESPQELTDRLEKEGYRKLYIDGGITIQRFLDTNLIDDMIITTIPVLLGNGKPLFGHTDKTTKLKLLRTESYSWGFVQNKYQVVR